MASTSCGKHSPLIMKEPAPTFHPYPPAVASYEEVVANPQLFLSSLENLHATLMTKFMIPIIGGKELDLHRLFVEVTSRGGFEKIMKERRWKEVTNIFNFPSTATNASFVLRKYYLSLLNHYEQLYFFKAPGWYSTSTDSSQSPSIAPSPKQGISHASGEVHASAFQQSKSKASEPPPVGIASAAGSPVIGVIDGKFESGYLVTVTIGSETLKGVLYQAPQSAAYQQMQQGNLFANRNENVQPAPGTRRRRRRKKSEIKRRDPSHPKPNRSGYNFFFAEQHARLKPLHPGKDREISRMIGELWNNLKDSDKSVYQEKALKDKERYRLEMEDYRERQRTVQLVSDAVPLQQLHPEPDADMVDADAKLEENEGADSPRTIDNESSSGESDSEDAKIADKVIEMEVSPDVEAGGESGNADVEISSEEPNFRKLDENVINHGTEEVAGEEGLNDFLAQTKKEPVPTEAQ